MTERIEELLRKNGIKCIPNGERNSTELEILTEPRDRYRVTLRHEASEAGFAREFWSYVQDKTLRPRNSALDKRLIQAAEQMGCLDDEYHPSITHDSTSWGRSYAFPGIFPLTQAKARLMFCRAELYKLYPDGGKSPVRCVGEIWEHDWLFGVVEEEWKRYFQLRKEEKDYAIVVRETLQRIVIARGQNLCDAIGRVKDAVECDKLMLDSEDFDGREYASSECYANGLVPDGEDVSFYFHLDEIVA